MHESSKESRDETAERLRLEHFLPYRLSILSNTISGSIAAIYAERFDLSIPEWRVMAIVGRKPGLSAIEVAERALMDKVAVSRAVAKLLKTGRLAREFADQDRRRSILSLTEDGNRVHAEVAELALDYETKLLAGIADEDVERLGSLIDKLLDRARGLGAPSL
ncbi:MAG: MarR family transcriptional regulator [Pseudomonadota bacterium]